MSDDHSRDRRSPDRHEREHRSPDRHEERQANQEIGVPGSVPGGVPGGVPNSVPGEARGWYSRGYLPHYDGASVIQHVTVHLADSLPKSAIEKIDQSLMVLREEQKKIERRKRMQAWIDAGYGSCVLKHPDIAAMMQNTFLHFNDTRYRLHAWVVMPNHFHVLVQPLNDWLLSKIVASWKKFSAKKILEYSRRAGGERNINVNANADANADANQEIGEPGITAGFTAGITHGINTGVVPGIRPPVWQREFWDRYIRNERHYEQAIDYIHNNPVSAGLVKNAEAWSWSSAQGLKV